MTILDLQASGTTDLDRVAETLEETGWAAALVDSEWRVRWISSQLRAFMGGADDSELGVGHHFCDALRSSRWHASITADTRRRWLREHIPYVAHDTPGGMDRNRELVSDEELALIDGLEAEPPPPLWGWTLEFLQDDLPPASARCLA